MAARNETEAGSLEKKKKLIICGLENSGKTSINTVLTESISSLGLVKPTHLVKRNLLKYMAYEIYEQDMGGQETYIARYFKEPVKYFGGTDVCVFVVDIQDEGKITEAMKYLKDILAAFLKLSIKPALYIFLHKAERFMSDAFNDAVTMERVQELAATTNENRFAIKFFRTTIFEPYTVLRAFGEIVTDLFPLDVMLLDTMEGLAVKLDAEIAVLMDDHLMPIVDNIKKKENDEIISHAASNIYFLKQSLDKMKNDPTRRLYVEWEGLGFTLMRFPPAPVNMYLLVVGKTGMVKNEMIEKELADISQEVFRILKIK